MFFLIWGYSVNGGAGGQLKSLRQQKLPEDTPSMTEYSILGEF